MAAQKEHPFAPAPPPPTELGRYRILSKTSGLRVSPLCLGAMSIGEAWADTMGAMTKKQSFELLDAFSDAGGNFIDTVRFLHRHAEGGVLICHVIRPMATMMERAKSGSASGWLPEVRSSTPIDRTILTSAWTIGNRDEMVIATKFTGIWKKGDKKIKKQANVRRFSYSDPLPFVA